MSVRVAKFIADSGVASRRAAEDLISRGVVTVNGRVIDTPVTFVDANDVVAVNGVTVRPRVDTKLYAFHKPINTMTTAHDTGHRKTIYDILPPEYQNLKYVGRLDYKTTGLLLMTNDGELARRLTLPSSNIPRQYMAMTTKLDERGLERARRGITVDGIKYRPMDLEIIDKEKNILRVTVTEGKKNEIRIVLRSCGCPVAKLHRISFGPVRLGNLSVGKIREINQKTIDVLLKTL